MKNSLTETIVGILEVPKGKVDITDPCYKRDVWCRMNQVKIKAGSYECFACEDTREKRIATCGIRIKNYPEYFKSDMEKIGNIGVDAGLAGFFPHKPDYSQGAWGKLCDNEFDGAYPTVCLYKDGFCTSSGWGDGSYDVYAAKDQAGEIFALEIRFMEEDDDESDC